MTLLPYKLAQTTAGAMYALSNFQRLVLGPVSTTLVPVRHAARKGTREKKRKAKVKTVIEKVGFIPHNQRDKEKLLLNRPKLKFDDSSKKEIKDDVFFFRNFKLPTFSFTQALEFHRETHHPEMYNKPNEPLHVSIELNMVAEKKTRLLENFTRIAAMPHKFDHGEERSAIVFCKDPDLQKKVTEAGAQLCGGVELIKQIQTGHVALADFKFFLAHPDILPELVALRGLMKRRFPNPKLGTLHVDLVELVHKFMDGLQYSAKRDEYEKDFGLIQTAIGTLNMDAKHLEANYAALVQDVYSMKPKRDGPFIYRCLLWSPPSKEKFQVEFEKYVTNGTEEPTEVADEEGERIAL